MAARYSPLRVRIANRRDGGLWWRIPVAAAIWLVWAAPIVAGLVAWGVLRDYAADLPRAGQVDAWLARWEVSAPRTSVIAAADGSVVADIPFRVGDEAGHRLPVAFADIPPVMVAAVLAAEDARFFDHGGVDPQAVVRAAIANYRAGRVVEGASTITQQLARNLLPDAVGTDRSLRRKVREALLARRIEQRHTKQRIFELYANYVFLGAGAYGVAAAARAYFSKPLSHIDAAEAALIAGLIQAPGRADPYVDMAAARARRDHVLARMAEEGAITEAERDAAIARPVALAPPPQRYGALAPWHTERVRAEIERAMPDAYRRGGLRVETAAAPALAIAGLDAARGWTERLGGRRDDGPPQVGALVWDHRTGYVEATFGGRGWGGDDGVFDRATQACRQPGSAFKPIVYAAALESNAITPGTALRDAPIAEYDEDNDVYWKPTNSGRAFRGVALAQDALASSLNAPAVDVLDRVGTERVIDLVARMGIETEVANVRPMALGASCVVPLDLAGAFAVFATGGERVEPVFVTRVTRGDEVLVDRASPVDPYLSPGRRLDRVVADAGARRSGQAPGRARVLDAQTAFLVSNMLADVVRRGTGTAARALDRPSAGKTGTTNDNTDAWFVGYTGRVVTAVWVGYDDPSQTLGARQDGSHAALPLWMRLVRLAEGGRPVIAVPGDPPAGLERARIDPETGFLAAPGGGGVELYFKPGTAPVQRADRAGGVPPDLGRMSREF